MSRVRSTKSRSVKYSILIAVFALALTGCNTLPVDSSGNHSARSSSSLVTYLYPNGESPPGLTEEIPQLTVPVRIGIAFVPGQGGSGVVSDNVKRKLLRKVKKSFRHHAVVQEIRILPVHALRSQGGFRELRRLASRYNVDLIALVSHNQIRAIRHNALSVSYITIVGALILPGNSHDVSTFIDTAVFDVSSGKLLFHAAGKDRVSRQTSALALAQKNRLISRYSIRKATADMITSLNTELTKFRTRIRSGSHEADVRYRRHYKGSRVRSAASADQEYFNRHSGQRRHSRQSRQARKSRRSGRYNQKDDIFGESDGNR